MAVATFDLAAFRARYPVFSVVADATLGAYFAESGMYLDNTDSSPVVDLYARGLLLNMLVSVLRRWREQQEGAAGALLPVGAGV